MTMPIRLMSAFVAMAVVAGCQSEPQAARDAEPEGSVLVAADRKDARPIMRRKLGVAHGLLQAITVEDFKTVETSARTLSALSVDAQWQVHQTLTYKIFSEAFQRATADMAKHAKDKKIEAVTLDYMQMVMTCVKCHSYMRHEGLATGPEIDELLRLVHGAE